MNVDELFQVLKKIEDRAAEQDALRTTLMEINAALCDVVVAMERSAPTTAAAIAQEVGRALRSLRLDTPRADPGGFEIDWQTDREGNIRKAIVTPITRAKA